jgi:dihydrofolate synthase/folylpolyglutamate synthase
MNYREALDFLFDLELFGVKLGLTNITKFLNRLGNPQNCYPTVHVAGTNGKGSTAAMIEAMLVENGYKVGKFTSPHLVDYRERFRINKRKVSEEFVAEFVADHKEHITKDRITFFETATALAFQLFKDEDVDVAIAEVGLGGRLDATNVLVPSVSVITQLALDHLKVLGNTMEKIATEKAGIIKQSVPVVTSATDHRAIDILASVAGQRGASIERLLPEKNYRVEDVSLRETRFTYSRNSDPSRSFETNMSGAHMAENAALGLLSLDVLRDAGIINRTDMSRIGLRNVHWPGRFHVVEGDTRVIFDVAHNPHGMNALAENLEAVFPGKKFIVVLGVLQRRDFALLFEKIARFSRKLVICRPKTSRAAIMEELVQRAIANRMEFTVIEDAAAACDSAEREAANDGCFVVTGSHFTVGEVFRSRGIET